MQALLHTGNGSYGDYSSPISITFNFAPTLIIMAGFDYKYGDDSYADVKTQFGGTYSGGDKLNCITLRTNLLSTSYKDPYNNGFTWGGRSNQTYVKKSSDGKTIYLYSNSYKIYNENYYIYLFIGVK